MRGLSHQAHCDPLLPEERRCGFSAGKSSISGPSGLFTWETSSFALPVAPGPRSPSLANLAVEVRAVVRFRGLASLCSNAPIELRAIPFSDSLTAFLPNACVEVTAVAISHGLPSVFGVF